MKADKLNGRVIYIQQDVFILNSHDFRWSECLRFRFYWSISAEYTVRYFSVSVLYLAHDVIDLYEISETRQRYGSRKMKTTKCLTSLVPRRFDLLHAFAWRTRGEDTWNPTKSRGLRRETGGAWGRSWCLTIPRSMSPI